MKVRMLISMSGPSRSLKTGDIVDVSPEVGAAWVGAHFAEVVKDALKIEPKQIKPGKPAGRTKRK